MDGGRGGRPRPSRLALPSRSCVARARARRRHVPPPHFPLAFLKRVVTTRRRQLGILHASLGLPRDEDRDSDGLTGGSPSRPPGPPGRPTLPDSEPTGAAALASRSRELRCEVGVSRSERRRLAVVGIRLSPGPGAVKRPEPARPIAN